MSRQFEYGHSRIRDLRVVTAVNAKGQTEVKSLLLDGESVRPSGRFWNSLHLRFGFTSNIFRYFRHDEVFQRISEVAPNDQFRWCLQRDSGGEGTLLAVTNPGSALIEHDELIGLLNRYEAEKITYSKGVIRSIHAPRLGGTFAIAGDDFQNKFVLDTPIDGFGRPQVYLSLLRLICSNGAIGYSPAFRSELNVGRAGNGVEFALVRVLDGFNNEEGYAALRQRFESASRSWASVNEVNHLYRTLVRMQSRGELRRGKDVVIGGDGAAEALPGATWQQSFQRMTGDLAEIYGMANLDALSAKRQRTLPTACKVYDLLNFTSELATHHANADGGRTLQAFLGGLISGEYDLEGTVDHFSDWRDFFIGSEATTQTLTDMHRR